MGRGDIFIPDTDAPPWWQQLHKRVADPIKNRWDRISVTNQRWIAAGLLSVAVFVFFQIIAGQGFLQTFELDLYDRWVSFRPKDPNPVTPILVVGIDDRDIEQLGQSQISDAKLAALIRSLEKMGPCAIGVDLVRDMDVKETRPETLPKDGPSLQDITVNDPRYDNVVFVMKLSGTNVSVENGPSIVFPPPKGIAPDDDRAGTGDILEDADGIARRALLYESVQLKNEDQVRNIKVLSFPMAIAQIALNPSRDPNGISLKSGTDTVGNYLKFGNATLRPLGKDEPLYVHGDTGGFQVFVDYRQSDKIEAAQPIRNVFYRDVLASNFDPDHDVKNKIVLIGKLSQADKDYFSTPLQRDDFGINLHARLLNQILRYAANGGQVLHGLNGFEGALWLLAWCLLGGVLGNQLFKPWVFAVVLVIVLAMVPVLSFLFFLRGIWVPAVGPSIAFFTATTFVTATIAYMERETIALLKRLANIFGDLGKLPPSEIKEVIETGRIKPRDVYITVLFTDLKDFSDISKLVREPKPLMEWLNEYMNSMTDVIKDNHGYVNKYMGDAIMAIFGAPVPSTDPVPEDPIERKRGDARSAISCALAMRNALYRLNADFKKRRPPQPLAKMRIGIYSGGATSGSLGSKERLEYTVTGDIVNAAARLEAFRKEDFDKKLRYCSDDCRILIGHETFALVGSEFETVDLGEDCVKGVGKIRIFGVCGEKDESPRSESTATLQPAVG